MKNLLPILLALSIAGCSDDSSKPSPDSAVTPDITQVKPDTKVDSAVKPDITQVKPDTKVDGTLVDTCPACASDEVCVQGFDGLCTPMGVKCVKVSAACRTGDCTAACDKEYCRGKQDGGVGVGGPYFTCESAPCTGKEIAGAIHCYGP